MNAQILKLPRRLELEHYVTLKLRKVDRILARLEAGDGEEEHGQRDGQASQGTR
jgi:hypothetical protein